MTDISRATETLGQVATTRTASAIHPANQDFIAHSGDLAGEAAAGGQLVYKHTDNKWYKSDANSGTAADKMAMGVCVKDVYAAGDPITVMLHGVMGGYTSLTPGTLYFASDTEGEIADAAGTTYLPVGIALTTDRIFFFPILTKALQAIHALGTA